VRAQTTYDSRCTPRHGARFVTWIKRARAGVTGLATPARGGTRERARRPKRESAPKRRARKVVQ
jgi:hypothetical protein